MRKLSAVLITLSMLLGIMPQITLAADITSDVFTEYMADASITYTFDNASRAIADGTITVNIPEAAKGAVTQYSLYWGSDAATPLSDYTALKTFADNSKTSYVFAENPIYTYTMTGNKAIPAGATHLLAVVSYTGSDEASGTYTVSYELPEDKLNDNSIDDMIFSYYVHSDVHAGTGDVKGTQFFKNFEWLKAHSNTLGTKFKGMIINGDIANQSFDYEFSNFEDAIAAAEVDFPIYIVQGNHDFGAEWDKEFAYRTKLLKDKYNINYVSNTEYGFDFYIEGYHFIGLTVRDNTYTIDTNWLERKIMEAEKSGKPTFVLNHVPLKGTFSTNNAAGNYCTNSSAIAAVYAKHPTVIQYSGHDHLALETDENLVKVGDNAVSYVETSAWMQNLVYNFDTSSTYSISDQAGRYVEVYPDKVVIKGMSLINRKFIPRAEHIITNAGTKFEGDVSIEYADLNAGSEVKVKLDNQEINTDNYSISWKINGSEVAADVTSYTVAAENQNVTVTVTDKTTGAYASAATCYEAASIEDNDSEAETGNITIDNLIGIKDSENIISVRGNIGAAYAGKTLKLSLVKSTDITNPENIAYFGECVVAADGSYTHKFKFNGNIDSYILLAKCGDADVTRSISTARSSSEETMMMDVALDSENKAVLDITNVYGDSMENAKVIIAEYNDKNELITVKTESVDIAFGEDGTVQTFNSANVNSGAYIRVFLWKSLEGLVPLSMSDQLSIPSLTAE